MSKTVMEYKIGAQIHILVSKKRARNDSSDLLSSSLELQFELCQLQTAGFQLLYIGLWKGWRKKSRGILWLIEFPITCARKIIKKTSFTFFRIRLLRAASRFCAKRRCTCHSFDMKRYSITSEVNLSTYVSCDRIHKLKRRESGHRPCLKNSSALDYLQSQRAYVVHRMYTPTTISTGRY